MRLLPVLSFLMLLGCERAVEPRVAHLDPNEAPTDAVIEGAWQSVDDGPLLLLNDDGTLRIEGAGPLVGRNWDRFADSLAFYYRVGPGGVVYDARYRVDSLTDRRLALSPRTAPFGGVYERP